MTFRNTLRKSGNHDIREIHKSARNSNIQYDQFDSIREALKHIRSSDVSCITEKLTTQNLVVKSIWEFVDGRFINQWSNVISHLPRNIFSFTIRYLNNTLAIFFFFSIWVFFHEHSRITRLQGKGEGISLTPHYRFTDT